MFPSEAYGVGIRLFVLVVALIAVPLWGRRWAGGSRSGYVAVLIGLALLVGADSLRLAWLVMPNQVPAGFAVTFGIPSRAAGYLLVLLGFLAVTYEVRRAKAGAQSMIFTERSLADQARIQEAKLRAILNCATEYCINVCDKKGLVTSYMPGAARILGWDREEVVGKMNVQQFYPPGSDAVFESIHKALHQNGCFEGEVRLARKNGETFPALLTISEFKGSDGRCEGYLAIAKDITSLKRVQNELRYERDFIRGMIETSEVLILSVTLPGGAITLFNRGAELVTGYSRDEVVGRPYREVLLASNDRPTAMRVGQDILEGRFGSVGKHEHYIVTKAGEPRLISWTFTMCRDEATGRCDVVAFGFDVTEQRTMQASLQEAKAELERANAELKRLATTDYLTELVNRRQADVLLEREIARGRRCQTPVGIALMDIDRFKAINDAHGHETGDAVLVHVAKLLCGRLRASDIVARYGGDEFLLILPDTALEDSAGVANMLRGRLAADPALCDDLEVALTGSFGVTVLRPGENLSVNDLLRMADEAMYSAKRLGGNRVVVWNQVQGDGESALLASDEVRLLERRVRAINEQNRDVYLERMAELIRDLESRHPYFVGHSGRVAEYATAIGRQMGLRPDEIEIVNRAAVLHDVGRYVIPGNVLSQSGPLSQSDWALVRHHPAVAERIVGQLRFLQREASVIRHHHERVDGRGYPDGLTGEAIPPESRILAVADALDAMTSPRPYREPYSLEEALEHLRLGAGSQFDARVAEAAISAAQEAGTWPLVAEPAPVASGANGLFDARERPRRTPPPRRR